MRTIWKGHIPFSMVKIPVRLYTAIDLEDQYYQAVQDMIEDKIEGKEIVSTEEEEEPEISDLTAALKESIKSVGNGQLYEDLAKDELYEKAKKADIKGRSGMTKDELIEALS